MLAPTCAALALLLAAPQAARSNARVAARAPAPARSTGSAKAERTSAARATQLERARAMLAEVKRDPVKRRYRHRWERAIRALEKAARGRDTAPALLDAARARYALYRFSQVDADRSEALALARRAQRAGAREAPAFAAAVRREMGEDERPASAQAARAPARRDRAPAAGSGAPAAPRVAGAAATRAATRAAASPGGPSATPGAGQDSAGTAATAATATAATAATAPGTASASTGASSGDDESEDPILEEAVEGATGPREEAGGAAKPHPGEPVRVSDVRSWSNGDYTRVAIYLSRHVAFTREEIPADPEHPRRLALDLAPALLDRGLARDVGDALVERVRAAQRDAATVRVVLDLAGRDDLTIFSLDDPPRLIVDVGVREAQREALARGPAEPPTPPHPPAPAPAPGPISTTTPPPAQSPAEAPAAPSAQAAAPPVREDDAEVTRRPVRRVIVDAGHGGHDTGAIGPSGVREKDVTLAMARRLAKRLRARGFEVVLTRQDDGFVALEERTAIANARRGDLFVSLHANAHPRRDRRGVETWVLNVADGRYAKRLAARENGALRDDQGDGQDVRRVLSDLDARSSAVASRRLAHAVQREVCAGIRTRVGEVRDLGVKSALFYVLLGARMPAVLVETSFISNRAEERRLSSPRFQEEVASAVARAVEGYAAREARIASAR